MIHDQVFVVDEKGETVTSLYDDNLPDFSTEIRVDRASQVEFNLIPGSRGWDVVLTDHPQNGQYRCQVVVSKDAAFTLGRVLRNPLYRGFKTRAEALKVEVEFINKNILGRLTSE